MSTQAAHDVKIISQTGIGELIAALARLGFVVIGPTVRDDAIIYDTITAASDLPVGWTDDQGPGYYRLRRRPDDALFGYVVGPHAWKKWLHPPRVKLWSAQRDDAGQVTVDARVAPPSKTAFLGVRGCDLAAIGILDRVLIEHDVANPDYRARRNATFIIAVNCTESGETCFCDSMGTGPDVRGSYDLAITELIDRNRHVFLVRSGSEAGRDVLAQIASRPADTIDERQANDAVERARQSLGRHLDTRNIATWLRADPDHPRWTEVAERCLTCGNCTMACPTCFCTTVQDTTDLTGDHTERWQNWDSCFSQDFTVVGSGPVRASAKARYRHWMTHKLATWHDQFGTSGCVGCGRCITWCPVGIDITEEAEALRPSEPA